uniref:Putative secreted protein n=1 Tax=Anopheles darlingi TaxID=43151 RepID=A0A2M4D7S3_ANODA
MRWTLMSILMSAPPQWTTVEITPAAMATTETRWINQNRPSARITTKIAWISQSLKNLSRSSNSNRWNKAVVQLAAAAVVPVCLTMNSR